MDGPDPAAQGRAARRPAAPGARAAEPGGRIEPEVTVAERLLLRIADLTPAERKVAAKQQGRR